MLQKPTLLAYVHSDQVSARFSLSTVHPQRPYVSILFCDLKLSSVPPFQSEEWSKLRSKVRSITASDAKIHIMLFVKVIYARGLGRSA